MRIKIGKITIQLSDLLFILIALLGFLTLLFTVFNNENILRILSYAFFLVGYFLYFYSIKSNGLSKINIISIVFFVYLLFLWAVNGFEYNALVVSLSFFLIFSSFESAKAIKSKSSLISIIYVFYLSQSLLLIVSSFTKYAYMSEYTGNMISEDLLLGLSNPNETGMALVYTIIGLLICINNKRNKFMKFISFIIIAYLVYLLVLTRARTSFLGLVIFVVLSYFYRNRRGKFFNNKFLYLLFIIYPMLFVPFYLYISMILSNRIALFGKTLFSGREVVYYEHFILWSNKILGNLTVFHLDNAHNGFFSIIINFGIIGLFIYCVHLFLNLNELRSVNCSIDISRFGFIAVLCIYFMSASESAFIVSGKFYFANFMIMTWLANYTEKEEFFSLNEKNSTYI